MPEQPPTDDSPLLIDIEGLSHTYEEGNSSRTVLRNANLQVREGESIALLGRSGCGKSTLLNLISGIEALQSGQISVGGVRLDKLDEAQRTLFRRRHIGFVYQFFHLFPTLTVAENIALVLELNNIGPAHAHQRVKELLRLVDLEGREDSYPDKLSGGEQQRIAIARAIAHEPTLVLADEPTGNLDAETGAIILEILANLVKEHGATLIVVTHSLKVAQITHRLITLEQGELAERSDDFAW